VFCKYSLSGLKKTSTRNLTLPNDDVIQWQMWTDCYQWDQQNGLQIHRPLTNEHIFPSQQCKMCQISIRQANIRFPEVVLTCLKFDTDRTSLNIFSNAEVCLNNRIVPLSIDPFAPQV
jgi:hypothetical protein